MATTILDAVTAGAADTVPTFTVSSGSNRRAFVLAIHSHGSDAAPATSCTLGGQTMSVLATVDDASFDVCATLFALDETGIAAMSGSTITPSGGTQTGRLFITWSVQGATQGTLTPVTAATSGTSGSVSLTRVADSYTVAFTVQDFVGAAFTGLADPSEAAESTATNIDCAYGYGTDTARTANFTWTHSTSRNNVTLALNIAPATSDVTAPTLSSATIGTDGTTVTLNFSESVSIGAGGNGGFAITPSGGAATLTYSSGSGSSSLVYTSNRTINAGETVTIAYTQPGNGVEDAAGNDLATFGSTSVTNNSTQGAPTISSFDSTPEHLATEALTGTGLPTSQTGSAAVKFVGAIETVTLTPTYNTSTALSAAFDVGNNRFGVEATVTVTDSSGAVSSGYSVTPQPRAGGAYVNLSTLAAAAFRLEATPDLQSGYQVEYYGGVGCTCGSDLIVFNDGTVQYPSGVIGFYARAHNGTSWGAPAFITISDLIAGRRGLVRPAVKAAVRPVTWDTTN